MTSKPCVIIARVPNGGNWMKDLRTELYQMLYEQPIYPKNLYLDREPMKHDEYREKVIQKQIDLMHERGIWVKPER